MAELTIWCNADLSPDAMTLLESVRPAHNLVFSSQKTGNLGSGGACPDLAKADIAFGQPDENQISELGNLKWAHITSAGYTRYDNEKVKSAFRSRGAQFSNSSSVYDDPCAEHIVAFILAQSRQLPASLAAQYGDQQWAYAALRPATKLLKGQTILLIGFGAIARRLVELLTPFGVNFIGIRRTLKGDEPIPMALIKDLPAYLAKADHVVNILPASPETEKLFNGETLAKCKPGAIFYNIGRGTTVDQPELIASLESGHIGAAYLDVTTPEPLPPTDPLWKAPNCAITPHIAGGFEGESVRLVEHFLENLTLYAAGKPIQDRLF